MPKRNSILIKYEDLHPNIRAKVSQVLEARRDRFQPGNLISDALWGVTGGSIAVGVGDFFTKKLWPIAIGSALVTGAVPFVEYKKKSPAVREKTAMVGNEAKARRQEHFDSAQLHSIAELERTHPIGFIHRNGDVELIPNTAIEKARLLAQRSFLKHIMPGRYRFDLRKTGLRIIPGGREQ